ncbi:hypothetical protein E1182_07595 [Micromonospora sp. KC721]|nr:hypothetical protein E1182_07595 [Micromonospora sp. KC721]
MLPRLLALTSHRRVGSRLLPVSAIATPRRRRVAGLRAALSLALVAGGLVATAPAQAAEVTNGLVLRYKLDETSGTVAVDSSGNGRNGTVNGTATWGGTEGLAFDGSSTYIQAPNNIMAGLNSISVAFNVFVDTTQGAPYFLYGFGNVSGARGNGYLFTTGDDFRTAISNSYWVGEQSTRPSPSRNLARGVWKHVTYTQTGTTGVLYEDGVEVGRNTSVTLTPGSIGNGTTTADYIGRSLYSADKLFKGKMRDFRVYNRALSAAEVAQVAQSADQQTADAAAAALVVRNINDVRGNLTLPTTGADGTTVSWSSSNPQVITTTGEVNRPATGAASATVTLTATVTKNAAISTRTFTATVPPRPAVEPFKGYLFSYFAPTEQVYFGLSEGNDPLNYRQLNNGNPVLVSALGEKGARDPYIVRSPEGDKFYQIATDLRIGSTNWDAAQRTGSKSILVWESTDLVNWSPPRLVKISPDTAGNTWAPEAYWDDTIGAYVVIWASKLYAESDPNHTANTYNKMMYATTRDFYTFSEPKIWVDPGYSVIDSTVLKHNGSYYRFTKDERNNTSSTPCSKYIIEQKSTTLRNLSWDFVKDCIGRPSIKAGEGPLVFKSNTEDKWYLFIDEFVDRGYVPFESTDPTSGNWTMSTNYSMPGKPRHGTVLPVTAAEYNRLLSAYQPNQAAVSAQNVSATTGVNQAPVLPATVPATLADGSTGATQVTWDAVPASAYAQVGTFTVQGTPIGNANLRVTATVTVQSQPVSHLLLHYKFDESSGTVVQDSSGRGFNGTYNRTPAWGTGVQGGSFKMAGGASNSSTAPYVTIPNGVLNGVGSTTVSYWVKWNASTTINQWICALGADTTRYLFTTPRNNAGLLRTAVTTDGNRGEYSLVHNAALPGDSWQHVAVTIDAVSRTMTVYLNGTAIATAAGIGIQGADLFDPTKGFGGYIGKSLYPADPYFSGEVDNFRIYRTALSASEIAALASSNS